MFNARFIVGYESGGVWEGTGGKRAEVVYEKGAGNGQGVEEKPCIESYAM